MKKRILTGDTPTGKLHLGHYAGTLENRLKFQDEYEEFIILADLHSFTTLSEYPEKVRQSTLDVVLDNLSVGLDPEKVHFFIESQIPEIYELASIYSMLVSHARALRNPTIKDEITMKGLGETFSLGFVNYPIFQAADITCVGANLVPVGKDQLPHIEQTREIVDKFNTLYGEVLVKPEGLVGRVGKLVGTDGNPKMGKSLGNTIMLSATSDELKRTVKSMYTDPSRIHPTDPGKVEGNPVFIYHDNFNPNKEEVASLKARYLKGTVGDVEVKEKLFIALNEFLEPIREKRAYFEGHMDEVFDILKEGTKVTREETQKTLEKVREAMKIDYAGIAKN
jgi:tryptophanyl-tRNA synthetase